jgi:hypothetical protein
LRLVRAFGNTMSQFTFGGSLLFPALFGDRVFRIVGEFVNENDDVRYYCVGYDDIGAVTYWVQYSTLDYWRDNKGYSFVEDASTHSRFAWLPPEFITAYGKVAIAHPEQLCMSCKRPAPHVEPNRGNEFVCSWCNGLQKLDLVI